MDWDLILNLSAAILTVALFATNIVTVKEFKRNGTTYPKPYFPFLATFINCTIWTKYGILLDNKTIYMVNGIGLIIMTYCVLAYYYFAEKRRIVERHSLIAYFLLLGKLLYVKFNHTPRTLAIVGMSSSIAACVMFASPLLALYNIIKTKDASGMSFPLAVVSLNVASLWAAIGLRLDDYNIVVPNVIGATLSLIQVVVCLMYRKPKSKVVPTSAIN